MDNLQLARERAADECFSSFGKEGLGWEILQGDADDHRMVQEHLAEIEAGYALDDIERDMNAVSLAIVAAIILLAMLGAWVLS